MKKVIKASEADKKVEEMTKEEEKKSNRSGKDIRKSFYGKE